MIYFISISIYLIFIIVTGGYYLWRNIKQTPIKQWKKTLNIHEHEQVFQQLYQNINGFLLSKQAREKYDILDYVYGEIDFLPFLALLSLIQLDKHSVFYDLGCGIGKAVLACAMVYPVHKSVGIEILPELYFNACNQKERLAKIPKYTEQIKKINFILGDFLEINLDDATIIFINATAFFNPTWEKICTRIDQLPHLNTVITTSKALCCKHFNVVIQTQVEMSWGIVFAYIHTRKKIKV